MVRAQVLAAEVVVQVVVADSAVDAFRAGAVVFLVAAVLALVVDPVQADADHSSVVAEVRKDARPCSEIAQAADSKVCAAR